MKPEQLDELKKLTVMTRKMSEWHEKNLKQFVMIALDNIETAKIEYDLGNPDYADPGFVTYQIARKKGKRIAKNKTELNKRLEALDKWTRAIFWNDIKVNVVEDGKTIL